MEGSALTDADPHRSFMRELELRLANVRLSANDERILAFLREHLDELPFHTSQTIAQGAGVSRAAVVRFARRVGYGGFAELRASCRQQLQAGAADLVRPPDTLLRRKIRRDIENSELLATMLGDRLEDAAQQIVRARRLWVLANRETQGLAVYLYRLMHHVRSNVELVDPAFPDPLRDLGRHDAVLACTFRPYARQTMLLVEHARRTGAHVVVLTDGYGHAFLADSDTVLAVPVESPTMFLSFASAVSALEVLAAYVARTDGDQTYHNLEATEQFVDALDLMLEPGPPTGQRKRHRGKTT